MNNIISLQETSANFWIAKYQGNHGIYTIKLKVDGSKIDHFSCSCPSDRHPCKHIAFIKSAIDVQKNRDASIEQTSDKSISIKDILDNVSNAELRSFIIDQARYNTELANKIQLKFLHTLVKAQENGYNKVLSMALTKVHYTLDEAYEYDESCITIDILDEWLAKASENIALNKLEDALAIAKACLEEYADWAEIMNEDVLEYIDPCYQEEPFELFTKVLEADNSFGKGLFDYCFLEQAKRKYADTLMFDLLHDLLQKLAESEEQQEKFLALQDELLLGIEDKSSTDAEIILVRKVAFYYEHKLAEQAQEIMRHNIQIKRFRKLLAEQHIAANELDEAKGLINGLLSSRDGNHFNKREWQELLLTIAQKENDVSAIRSLSFLFIERRFNAVYYKIYKATFSQSEWRVKKENLIGHYKENSNYFVDSIAELLVEEEDHFALLQYVSQYLSVEKMERYFIYFHVQHPRETLQLFEQSINKYAANNLGRHHYEYIIKLFGKIREIEGGIVLVRLMVAQFTQLYKNRRAMIELLNGMRW